MAYWWVNQKQTWRHEIYDGYLWSPKLQSNGHRLIHYDWMQEMHPGDIVLSYVNGVFRFAGVVREPARSERRPDFGFTNVSWSDDGWSVPTDFVELPQPVHPAEYLHEYRQFAPERYGPINAVGGVQPQYLFALPDALGTLYLHAGGLTTNLLAHLVDVEHPTLEDGELQDELPHHTLTETERLALVSARRGQGFFKEEVRRHESACRVTGLSDPRHLIASHMKPWREATNAERLDGYNGLLLSPHVDHLFDRGLITFERSGHIRRSPLLPNEVVTRWQLDLEKSGRSFSKLQHRYLEYHQDVVFQSG